MAKATKPRSLTALAKSLDTRKQPLPGKKGLDAAQRRVLERAVRPEVRPRIEAALARQPLAQERPSAKAVAGRLVARAPTVASAPAPKAPAKPVTSSVAPPRAQSPVSRQAPAAPARPVTTSLAPPRAANPVSRPVTAAPPRPLERTAALSSLRRSPSPAPAKLPTAKPLVEGDARRRYPRAEVQLRASLALADDPTRVFEATLPTVNLSVGGLFLESSFFLKVGTRLLVTLQLPRQGREVKVKGEVVRLESNGAGPSGFALRFTEYLEGSQVVLATHFLSPVLREFLGQYAKEHRFEASPEYLAHTADVLAAWELKKAELGGDVWALFSSGA